MPRCVGQISLFPFTFAPQGWIFCDGRLLPIAEYDTLFTRLRNTFGGDGETTFGVPDLRSIAPQNCQYFISLFGYYEPEITQFVLGQTMISAFAPDARGILKECAGQSLSTAQYRYLETLMGTRFGGDGTNNFNLPDLRGKAPAHCSYTMAVLGKGPDSPEDIFVGELLLLPYEPQYAPNLKLCNGELLPIAQNTVLFRLLGNRFGGDGKQTFALPNLSAAAPSQFNYYICVQGTLPLPS